MLCESVPHCVLVLPLVALDENDHNQKCCEGHNNKWEDGQTEDEFFFLITPDLIELELRFMIYKNKGGF